MAEITIQIPDDLGPFLADTGPLLADSVEMRDLIAWNMRQRADDLIDWSEGAERSASAIQEVVAELGALARAHAEIVGEPVKVGAA